MIQLLSLVLASLALASHGVPFFDNNQRSSQGSVDTALSSSQQRLLNDFMKLLLQKSLLAAIESDRLENSIDDENLYMAKKMVDELSATIRYVGVGYNILTGSPDGNFDTGGIDPGILSTRAIFDFTYDKDKKVFYKKQKMQVPDQVNFQPQESCSASNQISVYSGAKSYQKSLKIGVSPGVTLYGFRFGLSAAVNKADQNTAQNRRVNTDQKKICNMGRVEYLTGAKEIHRVSSWFQDAVSKLPVEYSNSAYTGFIKNWGTDMIVRADIGTKEINRSSASYSEVFKQLKKQNSGGIKFGGNFNGFGGSLDLDIGSLKINSRNSKSFGSRVTSFNIGSDNSPVPITLQLVPISDALRQVYWGQFDGTSRSYRSRQIAAKRSNLMRALEDYADFVGATELQDPRVSVKLNWPMGMYALPAAKSGCPQRWGKGYRNQTSGENIDISTNITRQIDIKVGNVIRLGYCVKETENIEEGIGSDWPQGRYCIARRGDVCPPEFAEGSITWNDKKTSISRQSNNSEWGKLPDGKYDKNTKIEFCCRNDGRPLTPVLLPIKDPFVLYRYGGTCQSVEGATVKEHFIQFDDNSVAFSKNECSGEHPDDDDCENRHKLHLCYYHAN